MKKPYATLLIILIATATYLTMSQGNLYVNPVTKMYDYGVKRDPICERWENNTCREYVCAKTENNTCKEYAYQINYLGAFTYSFMHIVIKHLLINMIMLLAIRWVIETKLEKKLLIGIFLFSGILAGLGYALANPHSWVIGASAGVAGMLVAAYLVDVKKTIIVLTGSVLLLSCIVLPLTDYTIHQLTTSHEQQLNNTQQEIQKINETIKQVEKTIQEKQEKGENATQEIKQIQNLTKQLNQTIIKKETVTTEKETIKEGSEKEKETPASDLIHMLGALFGIVYMLAFKRISFEWFITDLKKYWNWMKKKWH
ncbi:rhomboid family intramembrane serine protease [archaeon]|nr:rhomboid family intramembrane serine protease [archaeon]